MQAMRVLSADEGGGMSQPVLRLFRCLLVLQIVALFWFLLLPDAAPAEVWVQLRLDDPVWYALLERVLTFLFSLQMGLCAALWRPGRVVGLSYAALLVLIAGLRFFDAPFYFVSKSVFVNYLLGLTSGAVLMLLWLEGYFGVALKGGAKAGGAMGEDGMPAAALRLFRFLIVCGVLVRLWPLRTTLPGGAFWYGPGAVLGGVLLAKILLLVALWRPRREIALVYLIMIVWSLLKHYSFYKILMPVTDRLVMDLGVVSLGAMLVMLWRYGYFSVSWIRLPARRLLYFLRLMIVLQVGTSVWFMFHPAPAMLSLETLEALRAFFPAAGGTVREAVLYAVWQLLVDIQLLLCVALWWPVRGVGLAYGAVTGVLVVLALFGGGMVETALNISVFRLEGWAIGAMLAALWLGGYFSLAGGAGVRAGR